MTKKQIIEPVTEKVKKPKKEKIIIQEMKKTINTQMFEFQKLNVTIVKSETGEVRGKTYSYVPLDQVLEVVRPHLNDLGILMYQTVENNIVKTTLHHVESQTEINSTIELNKYDSAQDMGAWITYARRYSLVPMLGIQLDKDVDAKQGINVLPPVAMEVVSETKTKEQKVEQLISDRPIAEKNKPTAESTDSYTNAYSALTACKTQAGLTMVFTNIKNSVKLNSEEKVLLQEIALEQQANLPKPIIDQSHEKSTT